VDFWTPLNGDGMINPFFCALLHDKVHDGSQ
jgi:hypothetical protein